MFSNKTKIIKTVYSFQIILKNMKSSYEFCLFHISNFKNRK